MMNLEDILDFFSRNQIPILPCYGIQDGTCTCKRGPDCPSPGKHPLMFRWQMTATCDKNLVLRWIGTGTKPINLAIRTGIRNSENGKYLVGTDLDLVDHPMKVRLERYSRTVTQRSGSGGDHAFYWSDLPIRNSVQLVEEKMDIRGSGGIMVIAPSMHKSGNPYQFTCDLRRTEIQDLPEFLVKKLRIAVSEKQRKQREPKEPTTPISAREASRLVKFWGEKSINAIRSSIESGEKVPMGARNATMHRLLSSDRAKGIPSTALLIQKAQEYLSGFENPDDFAEEIEGIVKSVMRYPAYNNSHEKVNELYLGWLGKKGFKKNYDLETLESYDKMFFESLEICSDIDGVMTSLKEISEKRAEFLKAKGVTNFATYRSQLLSKKLLSMGVTKKKVAKGNFWMVRFKSNSVDSPSISCNTQHAHNPPEGRLNMTEELKDETQKKKLKDGDVIERNGKKFRVELINTQTKVKVHPREHLYLGKTGYDYNKALLALMPRMTEDMMEQFETGDLVMDADKTLEFLSQVKIGDVIGVRHQRYQVKDLPEPGHQDHLLVEVVKPTKTEGVYERVGEPTVTFLKFGEVDHARELGLLDILWRDGKPYGIDEFQDMTIVLLHDLDDPDSKKKQGKKKK